MVYIVLGMHKSGTTLVSEILHKSGVQMFDDQDGNPLYDGGNKYERKSTSSLNKDILDCWKAYSFDIVPTKKVSMSVTQKEKMIRIVNTIRTTGKDWGFKDPRTCLTYPLWKEHLPEHKLIIVYRHPAQILLHYHQRNKLIKYFEIIFKVLRAWKLYNVRILEILNNTPYDYLILNYEQLMKEQLELKRLSTFLSRSITDARRFEDYQARISSSFILDITDKFSGIFKNSISYRDILINIEKTRYKQISNDKCEPF